MVIVSRNVRHAVAYNLSVVVPDQMWLYHFQLGFHLAADCLAHFGPSRYPSCPEQGRPIYVD